MRKEGERASAAGEGTVLLMRGQRKRRKRRGAHAEPAAVVRSGSCTNTDISFVIM